MRYKSDRYTPEYCAFRQQVLERDEFICQVCGKVRTKTRRMVVHHVLNYSSNPDLRTDVDNGVCMCVKHHKIFHKIYWTRNNSQEQINEFIKNYKEGNIDEKYYIQKKKRTKRTSKRK